MNVWNKMKRVVGRAVAIAGIALLGAGNVMAQSGFWSSNRDTDWPVAGKHMNGTSYATSTKFTIHDERQLAQFAWIVNQNAQFVTIGGESINFNSFLGKTVKLMENIDLSEHDWIPIGVLNAKWSFIGIFDGNGKTISGMRIRKPAGSGTVYAGLFLNLYYNEGSINASVRNIRFTNVDVMIETTASSYVGAVAGMSGRGVIENCIVESGTVYVKTTGSEVYQHVGGIVGAHEWFGTIRNCLNAADVVVDGGYGIYAGGISGTHRGSFMYNCQNIGDVTVVTKASGNTYVGGIAGCADMLGNQTGNVIANTFNTGNVSITNGAGALNTYVGSLIGRVVVNDVMYSYWRPDTADGAYGHAVNPMHNIYAVGDAPGAVESDSLVETLNFWVGSKPEYLTWSVIPGMNNGYPVLTAIALMGKHTVTLDPNGGSGGTASVLASINQPMPQGVVAPTWDTLNFLGFFDSTFATKYYNTDMSSAQNWDVTADATLYALWGIDLTFNANGGSPTQTIAQIVGQKFVLPESDPTKENSVFGGWFTNADGTGTQITSAEDVLSSSAWEVFAKWMTLTVDPASKGVAAEGETFSVTVTSDFSWTASSDAASWLAVTPESGNGNGTLTVTVAPNYGVARNGAITVTGSGIIRTITVT